MAAPWDENDVRGFLHLIGGLSATSFLAQDRPHWVEFIVRFCVALRRENINETNKVLKEGLSTITDQYEKPQFETWCQKCALFFGVERDIRLVKFLIDLKVLSRAEIWYEQDLWAAHVDMGGISGSALLFALYTGREEVINYLLQDWDASPYTCPEYFLGDFESFNCLEYFTELFQNKPQEFSTTMSYEQQSIWFFCKRYLKTECPSEGWEGTAMTKLMNDEEFLMTLVRYQDGDYTLSPFWELYGHDQNLIQPIIDLGDGLSVGNFLLTGRPGHSTEQSRGILQSWKDGMRPRRMMTAKLIQKLQSCWSNFEQQWGAANGRFQVVKGQERRFPFRDGLEFLAEKLQSRVLQLESANAIDFISNLGPDQRRMYHTMEPADVISNEYSEICYLLAAAGSGKTRRMLKMLENRFGHYIVLGGVEYNDIRKGVEDRLYQPRASIGSGDADLLFRVLRQEQNNLFWSHLDRRRSQVDFDDRWQLLLWCRMNLFIKIFEEFRNGSFPFQPWHWLRYQLLYSRDADPFSRLLRCYLLSPYSGPRTPKALLGIPFLWCLDEVQCGFDEVTSRSLRSTLHEEPRNISPLSAMISTIMTLHGIHSSILAGTALNFGEIEKGMRVGLKEANDMYALLANFVEWKPPSIKTLDRSGLVNDKAFDDLIKPTIWSVLDAIWDATSPENATYDAQIVRNRLGASLVADETIFEDASFLSQFHRSRQRGLLGQQKQDAVEILLNYLRSQEVRVEIQIQSAPLRGRYRWSVCYIEELLKTYVTHGTLDKQSIQDASKNVVEIAKNPLKRRIKDLAESRYPEKRAVAEDVFRLALEAHLFDRSQILKSSRAAILIEQAIGYIEHLQMPTAAANMSQSHVPDSLQPTAQVSLAERIVVDAIIEYLEETKLKSSTDMSGFDKLVDDIILASQNNASVMGFQAEPHLAISIYAKARERRRLQPRQDFMSNFENVYSISASGYEEVHVLDIKDYVLEHAPGAVGSLRSDHIQEWLNLMRCEQPRPTFLLPSTNAGPDLMFVLRKTSDTDTSRLLCAVQLKTGNNIKVDGEVVRTIDPNQWYTPKKKAGEGEVETEEPKKKFAHVTDRRNFLFEWDECKRKNIKLLSILFLASNENDKVHADEICTNLYQSRTQSEPNFVQTLVDEAQLRLEDADKKARNPRARKLRQWEDNREAAEKDLEKLKTVQKSDYYLKILTEDNVASIFGPVFNRVLRGMKGKSVSDDEQKQANENKAEGSTSEMDIDENIEDE